MPDYWLSEIFKDGSLKPVINDQVTPAVFYQDSMPFHTITLLRMNYLTYNQNFVAIPKIKGCIFVL
jgi:hypothetical protein